jgi:aspartate/methionine/tyrosine aminotransferase
MFSSRLPARLTPNALSVDLARLRAAGVPLVDLTETNPTAVGLAYAPDLLAPLADSRSLRYRPSPFGDVAARAAVVEAIGQGMSSLGLKAQGSTEEPLKKLTPRGPERSEGAEAPWREGGAPRTAKKMTCERSEGGEARSAGAPAHCKEDGRGQGDRISADRVVLTSSTSEAYSMLFKLLCDPGDAVLVPQPSYPLFDLLGALDAVRLVPYRLDADAAWAIDRADLERRLTPDTRAILVVSPNNPTGSCVRADDRDWLVQLARDRGMAIVADEVFADYPLCPRPDASSFAGVDGALTFTLGGLSKSVGLPQVKLAWIVVSGPDDDVEAALARLEIIADTYLSVSTPVQVAAPRLIATGRLVGDAIRARITRNFAYLAEAIGGRPETTLLTPEGGWSAVLRVPAIVPEETLVRRLVVDAHVIVHPGYFFDFDREAYLVVSLLPKPEVFDDGVARVLAGVGEEVR